ncbi:MAG: oligosaccharide flippase family protein [Clostridia bacterium]|nr:oligosaccharide flippase family protein [Clostridia bacterium]
MKKSTKAFYATATLLTVFSLIERGFGFLYRIVLSYKLGEESLGVYQAASSVFGIFLTVGIGGLPVTLSRFIAKAKAQNSPLQETQTISSGLLLSALLSVIPALLFFIFSPFLSPVLLPDERCLPVLKILLLGSFFASAFACLRGYFWGNKRFVVPTLFEVLEESFQVISGIIFLSLNGKTPLLERVAWANTLAYIFSFSLSLIYFFAKKGKFSSPLPLAKTMFSATLPVTSLRLTSSLLNSAISVALPTALVKTGLTQVEAMKIYGVVTGMVLPVLFLPATLIGSLSVIISPTLSEHYYKSDTAKLKRTIQSGLTAAFLLAGGLIPLLFTLGEEAGELIFSSKLAGEMIRNACPILLPMTISMISTTILNSLGFTKRTFIFFLIGSAFSIFSVLLLPQKIGGYAYLVGTGGSFTLTAVCSLVFLQKRGWLDAKFYKNLLLISALILPTSLLGQLLKSLISGLFGELIACICIGILLLSFTVGLYFSVMGKEKLGKIKIFTKKVKNKAISPSYP